MAFDPPSRLRLLHLLEGPGAVVLVYILRKGTSVGNHHTSLLDYLNNLPQTSTANYRQLNNRDKMNVFTGAEQKTISADPTWKTFDVILLWKAIRLACENIAGLDDPAWSADDDCLESLLTKIKNERNRIVHEPQQLTEMEFVNKVSELRGLFSKMLEAAQTRYNISVKDIAEEKHILEEHIHRVTTDVPPLNNLDRYKLMELTESPAEAVLRFIVKHGINASSRPRSVKHYLDELPQASTANYRQLNDNDKRKTFTREEQDKMNSDPHMESFDVALLYKVIKLGCENIASLDDPVWAAGNDSLEGLITRITDERNRIIQDRHELRFKFSDKVKEFERLYSKLLEAAQVRYSIPAQEVADEKHKLQQEIADLVALWGSCEEVEAGDSMKD